MWRPVDCPSDAHRALAVGPERGRRGRGWEHQAIPDKERDMTRVRTITVWALTVLLAVPAVAPAADVIKVGGMAPTTGNVATFGVGQRNAYQLAVDEVNKAGGLKIGGKPHKIALIFEDEQNSPEVGATVARKLVNQDKVAAILGPTNTKVCLAVGPIAQENKIPMLTPTCTNPKVTLVGDFIFRAGFIDTFQGAVGAHFVHKTLGKRKAGVLFDNGNDYAKGLATYFKEAFEKLGGRVVAFESFTDEERTVDFRPQLLRIKAADPDVFYSSDYYGAAALMAKQAQEIGLKVPFMGGDGFDSPDLVRIGGSAVEGLHFTNFYSQDDPSPEVQQFIKAYRARYKDTPDAYAAQGYGAAQILFDAIRRAGRADGPTIRDALAKTKELKTVAGVITYDQNRNPTKPAVILRIKDGKQTFVARVSPRDLPADIRP
jgi:branched-chain amino acid transport system substrate-binding protein